MSGKSLWRAEGRSIDDKGWVPARYWSMWFFGLAIMMFGMPSVQASFTSLFAIALDAIINQDNSLLRDLSQEDLKILLD